MRNVGCGTSDHAALVLDLRKLEKRKPPFRFTNSWASDDGLSKVVEDAWEERVRGLPLYILTKKIQYRRSLHVSSIIEAKRLVKVTEERLMNDPTDVYAREELSKAKKILRERRLV